MKFNNKKYLIYLLLLFVACRHQATNDNSISKGRIVTDYFNREIQLPANINKILPLYYNECEILTVLGAKNKIIGVGLPYNSSTPDYFPVLRDFAPEIFKLPQVGPSGNVNLEKVIELNPDLILSDNNIKTVNQIENYYKVISIFPHKYSDIFDHIILIGNIVAKERNARQLVDTLSNMLYRVKSITNKFLGKDYKRIYYARMDILTSLNDSIHNEIFKICGGQNVLETGYPNSFSLQISIENLYQLNPDIIVIRDRSILKVDDVLFDKRLSKLKAVIQKRVYKEHNAWKEYRLESIFGIMEKAKWFHPILFDSLDPQKEHEKFLMIVKQNNEKPTD